MNANLFMLRATAKRGTCAGFHPTPYGNQSPCAWDAARCARENSKMVGRAGLEPTTKAL